MPNVKRPYEAQTWQEGDIITSDAMIHIENGIAAIDAELSDARNYGDSTEGTLGSRIDDMITVSTTRPSSSNNEIWVENNTTKRIELPTIAEFEAAFGKVETGGKASKAYHIGDYFEKSNSTTATFCVAIAEIAENDNLVINSNYKEVGNIIDEISKARADVNNLNATIDERLNNISSIASGAVSFTQHQENVITDAQKAIARNNIDAARQITLENANDNIHEIQNMIAKIERSTASAAHEVGEYIIIRSQADTAYSKELNSLYQVKAPIAIGDKLDDNNIELIENGITSQIFQIAKRIPDTSNLADGTYTLKVTIDNGAPTYTWVSDN